MCVCACMRVGVCVYTQNYLETIKLILVPKIDQGPLPAFDRSNWGEDGVTTNKGK